MIFKAVEIVKIYCFTKCFEQSRRGDIEIILRL